jgi:hypothetical protein
MITTTLLVIAALVGTGLGQPLVVARLSEQRPRARALASYALRCGVVALAGVAAAAAMAVVPATFAGLVGIAPLVRGVRRLTSVRLAPETAEARGDAAVAYVALVATRAGPEIAVATIVLFALAALAVVARPPRLVRLAPAVAAWTLLALGVYLLYAGRTLALFF